MHLQHKVSTNQKGIGNLLSNTIQLLGQVLNTISGFSTKSLPAVPN